MQAVKFKGTNVTMKAPKGAENIQDVEAFQNEQVCVTAWVFTTGEIDEINRTGKIYLSVFMRGNMPPVFMGAETETRAIVADYGNVFPKQDEII